MREKIYNLTRYVLFATALFQLARSPVHIEIITKVFATDVGFFLFMFIIFGIVVAFNAISMKPGKSMIVDFIGMILASIGGSKYVMIVLDDLQAGNVLTYEEAAQSLNLAIVSIGIYVVGTILLFFVREKNNGYEIS